MKVSSACTFFAIAFAALSSIALADEVAEAGRAIVSENRNGVVTIRLVVKEQFSMAAFGTDETESVREASGIVLNPEGLIVTSLTSTEPSRMMQNILSSMGGEDAFKMETKLSSVTILLEDGTELPGAIVIRDTDLDLAFFRPLDKPEKPLSAIDLKESAVVDQFDQLLLLRRLGKVGGRECAGTFTRVQAVLKKPRRLYVLEQGEITTLGAPAFSLDGRCVGMTVMRSISTPSSGGFDMFSMLSAPNLNMSAVVVSAEDILESAEQAPPVRKPKEE